MGKSTWPQTAALEVHRYRLQLPKSTGSSAGNHSCAKIKIPCLAQTSVILWEKLTTENSHTERKEITPQKGRLDVGHVQGRVVPRQMMFSSAHKQCVSLFPRSVCWQYLRKKINILQTCVPKKTKQENYIRKNTRFSPKHHRLGKSVMNSLDCAFRVSFFWDCPSILIL